MEAQKKRIILFSGKGGVGKTTVSAATALKSAELGKKTIVLSLDPAHSLADSFDIPESERLAAKGQPIKINEKLHIQELDIQEELDRWWGEVARFLELLFHTTGLSDLVAQELAILPGMEEVTGLLYVNHYYRKSDYEVIILDLPPTGETLRFISMPTILKWYMKKIFHVERLIMKVARPVAGRLTDVPLPDESYYKAIETFYENLKGVDEVLLDPEVTSIRLVTNPEKMVLKESVRAYTYFNMFGMNTDAVIVNKVFPKEVVQNCPSLKEWLQSQYKYLEEIEAYFKPKPILIVPHARRELVGIEGLRWVAEKLYADRDPTAVFHKEQPYTFEPTEDGYLLKIRLPYAPKEFLEVYKAGEEIIVRLGNVKTHILLPKRLADKEPAGARWKDGYLEILLK
ncbi:MAG: TRC40/GET3/ArsA family transport-energizing ATPase [Aquificae bacterium]|nr:TRC40/GET3/ArsA family transport-energizing ATPase [Aquificota bacterium]